MKGGTPEPQILYLPFLFLQLPLYRETSERREIANSAELAPVYSVHLISGQRLLFVTNS